MSAEVSWEQTRDVAWFEVGAVSAEQEQDIPRAIGGIFATLLDGCDGEAKNAAETRAELTAKRTAVYLGQLLDQARASRPPCLAEMRTAWKLIQETAEQARRAKQTKLLDAGKTCAAAIEELVNRFYAEPGQLGWLLVPSGKALLSRGWAEDQGEFTAPLEPPMD